ncbi:cytochrome c-type biogenesis protein CcmH [Erwinia endophytica]|uniref:cytochrome c-type biogenesis protein n=1 Tax=Erwinia endophytica TaxID=1563158 RepID=UPI001265EB37|nr:cytochrome c-type biogenesis protein [Erwinia endophytica]KAB8312163.1 cytochrome c-type biogenesis protein CcmH [Erwinia endophytica]
MKRSIIIVFSTLLFAFSALADNIDTYKFSSVDQEQQYRHLTESLRCPKCQNNSIADSNAMIAGDMRLKVYELLQSGQTPDEVKAYMVARYGNFVTYEPPLLPSTLILWAGPALFVIVGALVIILRSRKRQPSEAELDAEQQARLDELLKNNGKQS